MSKKNIAPSPLEDDGFDRTPTKRTGGAYLNWTDARGWTDRDGQPPPPLLLAWKSDEFVRRWKDNRPEDIVDKPLPDPQTLNSAIAESEWDPGIDGKPRPPWAHYRAVYFVDPASGKSFTYAAPTVGARIAVEELQEAVANMRLLRGDRCLPLVHLTEKPWKVPTGLRKRPVFEIVDWKTPGGEHAIASTPQLAGPNTAPDETAPAETAKPAQSAAKPKPRVKLAKETLGKMAAVEPVSTAEFIDDDLPY